MEPRLRKSYMYICISKNKIAKISCATAQADQLLCYSHSRLWNLSLVSVFEMRTKYVEGPGSDMMK